jgi:hypothetical protein
VKTKQHIKRPWWYTSLRGMHFSAYKYWWLYLLLFFLFLAAWYLFCYLPYCNSVTQCCLINDYKAKVESARSALENCHTCESIPSGNSNQIDSLRTKYGGSTGEVTITLAWQSIDDLDLYLLEPSGEKIYFKHKISQTGGGHLDVDKNAEDYDLTNQPIENIFFANMPQPGLYKLYVNYFRHKSSDLNVPYTVYVDISGTTQTFSGIHSNPGETHAIYEFTIQ